MLPLILGSIALTAVGFGVKEYCEAEGVHNLKSLKI